MNKLVSSPHLHGGDSVRTTMITVMLALAPATIVSVYLFGWLAALVIGSSVIGCMFLEWVSLRLMGRSAAALGDGSAALTGLFLALTLPATTPWWMVLIGCFMAIMLAKQVYGGLGYNLFNPALAARVVLLISFPLQMTTWVIPMHAGTTGFDLYSLHDCLHIFVFGIQSLGHPVDAVSMASALGYVKTEWTRGIDVADALKGYGYNYLDAFLGREAGSLGETSTLALLLGGVYLLARHTITWHIPFSYLGTVALLAFVFSTINPAHFAPPMFHLLAGGLMLCAFFMATDPVTSPVTPGGRVVFGVGCGILTWSIRSFGGYPEGAMFSVVLMNCTVPLIDHYFRPRVYGQGLSE